MKKRTLSLLLALVMLCSLLPVPRAEAAGFASQIIIAPQYEDAGNFNEGLASVKKDGKWGYINESGETVVDFRYDWAGEFSNGLAVVAKRGTVPFYNWQTFEVEDTTAYILYLIDANGMEVELEDPYFYASMGYDRQYTGPLYFLTLEDLKDAAPQYWTCHGGVVRVMNQPYTLTGKPILPTNAGAFPEFAQQGYDYFYQLAPAVDGVIPMGSSWVGAGGVMTHCFYMTANGTITKVFPIDETADFKGIGRVYAPDDGLILAMYSEGYSEETNWETNPSGWGVLDMNGSWIVDPVYINFYYSLDGDIFCEGLLPIQNADGNWGVINTRGETVIDFAYTWIGIYSEGYFPAIAADGSFAYLDAQGNAYPVAGLDGNEAIIGIGSSFNSDGVAAVYDPATGNAFCIYNKPENGMFPVIAGSEDLGGELYFPGYTGEGVPDYVYTPANIVTIQVDGLMGFVRINVDEEADEPKFNQFVDVPMDQYYCDPTLWAVENGITQGDGSLYTFNPLGQCTRAQVVTFLWRMAGKPAPKSSSNPFTDVKSGDYYYDAVLWAVENTITVGTSDTTFSPNATCTRAQVATFLWRAALEPAPASENSPFADVPASGYYYKAVLWAVEQGITLGTSATTFSPDDTCSRAQIVTFLYRFAVE